MTKTSWWREVWQDHPCPLCGAGPGDMCMSSGGHAKYEPHADRARLAAEHIHDGEDCPHCHDNPPAGHTCPRCGRRTP